MTRFRISDELSDRLDIVAEYYGVSRARLIRDWLEGAVSAYEEAIECEACDQIEWFVNVEPIGRA